MTVRVLDGTYRPGGRFHSAVAAPLQPSFTSLTAAGGARSLVTPSVFVLISMLSTVRVRHLPHGAPHCPSELGRHLPHAAAHAYRS